MTVQSTPGPWIFAFGSVYRDEGGPDFCSSPNATRIAVMDRNDNHTTPTERDANARLIAAAPDLLAACQMALNELSRGGFTYLNSTLTAAIRKAKGEA